MPFKVFGKRDLNRVAFVRNPSPKGIAMLENQAGPCGFYRLLNANTVLITSLVQRP
ncbi:MAG: hypothetical protein QM674_23065 [Burkholderiaceae bacterium]